MMADERQTGISRRDLLKGLGMAGAAAILPTAIAPAPGVAQVSPAAAPAGSPYATIPRSRQLENLTAEEADILEAIMARLIPNDELGPGAVEAGALNYIDRALGGFLSGQREAYRNGIAAFDRYATMTRGAPFVQLSTTDQDSVLIDTESGAATGSGAGFQGSSGSFFSMVKGHVWQGTFGDPYYGGNAEFIGWSLIRYPGVRLGVSAADQERLEAGDLPLSRRSAYDTEMFEKAIVMRTPRGGVAHGD
jgi:gluconate 2-dehydrogenase gamma chain